MYIILGRENCPFCDKAKVLVEEKGLPYLYIDITQPGFEHWRGWIKANGMTTVPQVFELLPGGYENLYAELEMKNVN